MKKKLIVLTGFVSSLAPVAAFAATFGGNCNAGTITDIGSVLCKIGQLLNAVVPVLIALAVVWFVWGVVSYMIGSDEEAKKKGRDRVIYGIIGFAVIVALWGLVNILTNTFGLTGSNDVNVILPTLNQ
ncbi:MAG: pilin [Candidatus Pacebacteria bacterium]|nr:pilin [Candidatus Paceibacterota bacterium]